MKVTSAHGEERSSEGQGRGTTTWGEERGGGGGLFVEEGATK